MTRPDDFIARGRRAPDRTPAPPWAAAVVWAALASGAALRLRHYLSGRSLWIDEALLANALLARPPGQLLGPLADSQAAPVGYLLAVQGAVAALGDGEHGLRLPALLCALLALPLFAALARRLLSPPAAPLAVGAFALAALQVYYAAEVKPYGPDVAVALALWLLGAAMLAAPARRTLAGAALLGAALVWCSYPAVMVLAGIGAVLVADALLRRDRAALLGRAAVGAVWLGSFVACYLIAVRPVAASDYLQSYWAHAFVPLPPRSVDDLRWYIDQPLTLFGAEVAGFRLPGLAAFAALAGAAAMLAGGRGAALALLAAPALAALGAAALRRYPFEGRLLLFLAPAVLMLVAEGLVAIRRAAGARARWLAPAAALILFAGFGAKTAQQALAPAREEARSVLEAVAARREPGDDLYIYYGAEPTARYYAPRLGLGAEALIYGSFYRGDLPAIRRELAGLAGRGRVWVVYSHVHRATGVDEERFGLYVLDGLGRRLDAVRQLEASAYLYDLP